MRKRRTEIVGILLIVLSLFVLLSLISYDPSEEPTVSPQVAISNKTGIVGVYVAHALVKMTIGYVSFVFPLLGLIWGWWLISRNSLKELTRVTLHIFGLAFITSVALGLPAVSEGMTGISSYRYAGLVGGVVAKFMHDFVGTVVSSLLLVAGGLLLILGYFQWSVYSPVEKMSRAWSAFRKRVKDKAIDKKKEGEKRQHTEDLLVQLDQRKEEELSEVGEAEATGEEFPQVSVSGVEGTEEPGRHETPEGEHPSSDEDYVIGEEVMEDEADLDSQLESTAKRYLLPPASLLQKREDITPSASHEELVEKANFLLQSLLTFGVEGKVVNISPGPIITLFEVEPAEGVRVNKFVQLSDDLARVMKASRVRVIAPIPGKASVGIEIPNENPSIVYLRSVITSEKYLTSSSKLTVALGKTTSGEHYVIKLDELPHLLIAGTTGSGKSVCIHTIITSLLFRATPDEVRFLLIDPKRLELAAYSSLDRHHLIASEDSDEYIITTPENAVMALRSVEHEMSRRYDVLADSLVRNINDYHQKAASDKKLEPMPFIVVIIDELADLMLRVPKEVEVSIARLAQLSRAVGIHLVLATQRPSVDVITGVIKANFPARIAFQVATKVDSRTIIDTNGAEKLLGKGDLLFLPPASSAPIRLHSSLVSLAETNRIVDFINQQPTSQEITLQSSRIQLSEEGGAGEEALSHDELFKDAVRLVVVHQQGSISLLQRRLRVGYARAARLIDEMEQVGIVGPFTGSKAREVLVDDSYLQALDDDGT
ncbi:MAG: DNA translocase FtsK [Candidatus Neomarinimicrobiota bacterium]